MKPQSHSAGSSWKNRWLKLILIRTSSLWTVSLIALAAIGLYMGSSLALRLSLSDLLPEDHPAVIQFEKITDIVGGVGYLSILLEAEDGKSHFDVAPKVVEAFRGNPLIQSASFKRDKKFFADRMLYYVPLDKLKEMSASLETEIKTQTRKAFDLGLTENTAAMDVAEKKSSKNYEDLKKLAKDSSELTPLLQSPDGKTLLVMLKPTFDSTDIGKSRQLIAEVESVMKELLPPTVKYSLAERYYSKVVEIDLMQRDILVLGTISLVLIAIVLWIYLGSFLGMTVVLAPVFTGLGITTGIATFMVGHINLVTGFLIGILSGLGVDYSVHLFLRYRLEKHDPSSTDPDPAWRALMSTGHSVFIGAAAAAGAFYLMAFSDFKAFSEFGLISGTGILAVFGTLVVTFKALTSMYERFGPRKVHDGESRFQLPLLPVPRGLAAGLAATAIVALLATRVGFLYDFDKMMMFSSDLADGVRKVDSIYGQSVVPSAAVASSKEEAIAIEEHVRKNYVPAVVTDVVSGATVVPGQQREKQAVLREMHATVNRLGDKMVQRALGVPAASVHRWLDANPFEFADLPQGIQNSLRGMKHDGYLLYLYPGVKLGVYEGIQTYANMFRDLQTRFPKIITGSDAVIFADILDLIHHDGAKILAAILVAVGLFIFLNVRHWGDSLASYLPLLLALPVGMGLMAIAGVEFNILNITIIPSFVALGIDVPIHVVHRWRETGSGYKAARDIAPSVHLSLLTSALGFGVLIFAKAAALQSLGWVALLGTLAIWWVGLVILPASLEWKSRRTAARKRLIATPVVTAPVLEETQELEESEVNA